jgi:hypothetical protein
MRCLWKGACRSLLGGRSKCPSTANWKSAKTAGSNLAAAAVATSNEEGEFILSGIAINNWSKLLMPEGLEEHDEVEEESVREVTMPEDIDETNEDDYNAHWFPFEWFLDTNVGLENGPYVTSDLTVMSTNKNHKSSVVDQIANGYLLECELGLKAMDNGAKITFPNVRALLTDPNVFIADSGATTHASASNIGLVNMRHGGKNDFIEVASGLQEAAVKIGDLPCIVCNQQGLELQRVLLHDVTYSPSLKFNLFSTSKLQREGWTMLGDYNSITMTKGDMKVCFDIVIPTEKGAIYCVYLKRGLELATVAVGLGHKMTMTIKQAHDRFGHNNEDTTRSSLYFYWVC